MVSEFIRRISQVQHLTAPLRQFLFENTVHEHIPAETGSIGSDRAGLRLLKSGLAALCLPGSGKGTILRFYRPGDLIPWPAARDGIGSGKEKLLLLNDCEFLTLGLRDSGTQGPVYEELQLLMLKLPLLECMAEIGRMRKLITQGDTERFRIFCEEQPEVCMHALPWQLASFLCIDIEIAGNLGAGKFEKE